MQETRVQTLGWEDSLENGMATPPWTEEPRGLQSMWLQKLDMTEQLTPTPTRG